MGAGSDGTKIVPHSNLSDSKSGSDVADGSRRPSTRRSASASVPLTELTPCGGLIVHAATLYAPASDRRSEEKKVGYAAVLERRLPADKLSSHRRRACPPEFLPSLALMSGAG
ncbi:hypothetical protein AL486_07055 [Pandoraea apista]|nr:hypothetical protein AT395_12160 [Pandoraea apista]AVF39493.1 hypothetical protein AL486_07055 [Pandoraea apista]OXS90100.1 hypothetical protein B7H01_18545 [Pandoraea apista]RRW97909.1 hypothetical protein EGJ54_06890 [Pandoraea apista]RRX07100.1 hypothetical protein EGJ56_04195 [Pandoraea apista]